MLQQLITIQEAAAQPRCLAQRLIGGKGGTTNMATKGNTRHTAAQKAGTSSASAKTSKAGTKRNYSPAAGEYVREEMEEMKQGKLKSGRSGQTVHNPKQAIAIGLSEARKAGAKVPSKPRGKAA
jgi:pyruvate/2-oxoglutarate dehydrogenase complex dihydrolipoamide acyltransferase (E2) component